jgi:xylose isomerase
MHANFEFMSKLGVDRWCFHDRDIAPEGATLAETNKNLDLVAEVALELQKGTNIRPLWGTAQLFKHPRYMHGAATSERDDTLLYASRQVHAQARQLRVADVLQHLHYLCKGCQAPTLNLATCCCYNFCLQARTLRCLRTLLLK